MYVAIGADWRQPSQCRCTQIQPPGLAGLIIEMWVTRGQVKTVMCNLCPEIQHHQMIILEVAQKVISPASMDSPTQILENKALLTSILSRVYLRWAASARTRVTAVVQPSLVISISETASVLRRSFSLSNWDSLPTTEFIRRIVRMLFTV